MDLSLFSTTYVPRKQRRKATPIKRYRILRNGQPFGHIDASSPVKALAKLITNNKPSGPIKRIACGAVSDVNNHHYQAVEA